MTLTLKTAKNGENIFKEANMTFQLNLASKLSVPNSRNNVCVHREPSTISFESFQWFYCLGPPKMHIKT